MLRYVFFHRVCPSEHLCSWVSDIVWPWVIKGEAWRCPSVNTDLLVRKRRWKHKGQTQMIQSWKNWEINVKWLFSQLCPWQWSFMLEWVVYINLRSKPARRTCSVLWQWTGREMKVSCKWLMVLPAVLSLSNWPEVIWVVSIELSICNEIIDPGSAKCRDPSLMQQEWWGYRCTQVPVVCASILVGFQRKAQMQLQMTSWNFFFKNNFWLLCWRAADADPFIAQRNTVSAFFMTWRNQSHHRQC